MIDKGLCAAIYTQLADVEDASLKGSFVVKKGVSCWQVLQDFSKAVWGAVPYVFGDTLFLNGKASESEVFFSDCGKGVAFTNLEYNRLRCKLISKVILLWVITHDVFLSI